MRRKVSAFLILSILIVLCNACGDGNKEEIEKEFVTESSEKTDTEEETAVAETEEKSGDEIFTEYSYFIKFGFLYSDAEVRGIEIEQQSRVESVPILSVDMPEDKERERRINKMIMERCSQTLPMEQAWLAGTEIRILYRSEKYLCFEYISHMPMPEGYSDSQLKFTLNLDREQWQEYPISQEGDSIDQDNYFMGSLYEEMESYWQKTVEEQSVLRGETGYELYEELEVCANTTFPCVQVKGLLDEDKQEAINEILKKPLRVLAEDKNWEKDDKEYKNEKFGTTNIFIAYKTKDWLSIVYSIQIDEFSKNWGDGIVDFGVTINMKTGERYMLDDLFEVNNLSQWICLNVTNFNERQLRNFMRGSIMTEQELIDINEEERNILFCYRSNWRSFYIYDGKFVQMGAYSFDDSEIPLREIYQFLKVDPWY